MFGKRNSNKDRFYMAEMSIAAEHLPLPRREGNKK
jgi:hypothetical protein